MKLKLEEVLYVPGMKRNLVSFLPWKTRATKSHSQKKKFLHGTKTLI
jgi:hypothetical protein